jgi:hypothetical protein
MKMSISILTGEQVTVTPTTKVLPLQELVETLNEDAVAQARQKLLPPQRGADLRSLLETPAFLDAFKYGIASGVAKALSENDKSVQAVYVYDPSTNPDSESGVDLPMSATVHLLVRVVRLSAALEAFIATLNRALTAELRNLPSDRFARLESVLDVNLVTEQQVRLGAGYAVLLSSVFAPAIKLWQREA